MTFAYYTRLSRSQQAVYRRSDAVTEVHLGQPDELRPLARALEAVLGRDDRAGVQRVSERLVRGLTDALRIPPVRVQVLAVRPHARWGELHGLYTAERGRPPRIQLWMRTARQRRVVAFRTYLRTLLHEVGHHVDYALLRLPESYHTEGFYKRESSLFHQLVSERRDAMPTMEEYAAQPVEQRMQRLARTADELADAIRGHGDDALARRPDARNWAPTEVICHLRDAEESFLGRFQLALAMDDPRFLAADPDRWAEDRQYLRSDPRTAVAAFRRRRQENLDLLGKLTPAEWQRGGTHATRGRMTLDDLVSLMAWHDDNHLDQLRRALDGKP